jgi:hypothetical protein
MGWLKDMIRLDMPVGNGFAMDQLAIESVKTQSSWRKFRDFVIWYALEYGTYGTKMKASAQTAAEDYAGTIGRRVAGRYLAAAERIGLLERVADAIPGARGTEYRVRYFAALGLHGAPAGTPNGFLGAYAPAEAPW